MGLFQWIRKACHNFFRFKKLIIKPLFYYIVEIKLKWEVQMSFLYILSRKTCVFVVVVFGCLHHQDLFWHKKNSILDKLLW